MKLIKAIIFLSMVVIIQHSTITCQEWRQIVPLDSDCESVMKALKIDKCKLPETRFENADYSVWVEFSELQPVKVPDLKEDCWNVKSGIVLSVSISLNKGISLIDYESDFADYEIKEVSDLPDYLRLINRKMGVVLTVINYPEIKKADLVRLLKKLNEGRDVLGKIAIQHISISPSAENSKKFRIACGAVKRNNPHEK